jgi:putative thiamine transport system permease protein
LLTASLALALGAAGVLLRMTRGWQRGMLTAGPSDMAAPRWSARLTSVAGLGVMVLCLLLLLLLSFAPRWPYPALLPPAFGTGAWQALIAEPAPLWLSLGLGLAAAAMALLLAVLWLESQPPQRDRWPIGLALLSLALPQLAVAGGQYRLFLEGGLAGSLVGLFLAHVAPVTAYVLIVLAGPYRAFDARYVKAARALSAPPFAAWVRVKLPLLRAPLLTAGAIGFAVSMVQFVPAQLIAAGRFSTLPMEAVTLSSGGNRALTAAFALALALPPLLSFLAAAVLGRPRWR